MFARLFSAGLGGSLVSIAGSLTALPLITEPSQRDESEQRVSKVDKETQGGRERVGVKRGRKHQGLLVPPDQYENTHSVWISSWDE